jgi:hypothetical protein
VACDPRAIFNSPDRTEAERHLQIAVKKYEKTAPKLAVCILIRIYTYFLRIEGNEESEYCTDAFPVDR